MFVGVAVLAVPVWAPPEQPVPRSPARRPQRWPESWPCPGPRMAARDSVSRRGGRRRRMGCARVNPQVIPGSPSWSRPATGPIGSPSASPRWSARPWPTWSSSSSTTPRGTPPPSLRSSPGRPARGWCAGRAGDRRPPGTPVWRRHRPRSSASPTTTATPFPAGPPRSPPASPAEPTPPPDPRATVARDSVVAAAAQAVATHLAEATVNPAGACVAPTSNLACRARSAPPCRSTRATRSLPARTATGAPARRSRPHARLHPGGCGCATTRNSRRPASRASVRYGRGAYRFRAGHGTLRRPEPPSFYLGLLRRGFRDGVRAGVLVGVAQVATAVGMVQEAAAARRPR